LLRASVGAIKASEGWYYVRPEEKAGVGPYGQRYITRSQAQRLKDIQRRVGIVPEAINDANKAVRPVFEALAEAFGEELGPPNFDLQVTGYFEQNGFIRVHFEQRYDGTRIQNTKGYVNTRADLSVQGIFFKYVDLTQPNADPESWLSPEAGKPLVKQAVLDCNPALSDEEIRYGDTGLGINEEGVLTPHATYFTNSLSVLVDRALGIVSSVGPSCSHCEDVCVSSK
jgi:hypothetical protein